MRYVGLLRGINLGPNRRIPMSRLREVLGERGYGEVRTFIASGNLVLDSALTEDELALDLAKAIEEEFGLDVPVVVRTGTELAAVLAEDPFGDVVTDPSRYSVTFLPEPPAKAKIRELPSAEGGEYRVIGRELYLWLPEGMAVSPLGKWPWDRLLGVAGTNRNWNTVTKLADMAG